MAVRDELFEDDDDAPAAAEAAAPRSGKPFAQFLRETPPAPMSQGVKVALWGAGALTVLLFLASLLKMAS